MKKSLILCLALLMLLTTVAGAETFSGTVTARRTVELYAPIGGVVETVNVLEGQSVEANASIASLDVTEVYASESGTVTGIFGEPGDSCDTVSGRYGAVMYIEGESVYTIAASTDNAYNATDTKFVHVGEKVFLSCYSDGSHTGTGVITSIEGTDYSVDVLTGDFLVSESVNVYRGTAAVSSKRIGRGTLTRNTVTAVTGSGSIVSIDVQDGEQVEKGQLLMTTLNGSYDGYYMSGTELTSPVAGTVASLNVSQGSTVEKGSVAAVIYPAGEMRVEAEVSEYDLGTIAVGDRVSVELLWNQDDEVSYVGTVTMISAVATESQSSGMETEDTDTTYTVYVDFDADAGTRYGMSAVVSTVDEPVTEYDDTEEPELPEQGN